ncbi:hypothetical protein GCM10020255_043150 [Rhodococcus baikonurensis]
MQDRKAGSLGDAGNHRSMRVEPATHEPAAVQVENYTVAQISRRACRPHELTVETWKTNRFPIDPGGMRTPAAESSTAARRMAPGVSGAIPTTGRSIHRHAL